MGAAYALLGLVLGIAINEALRHSARNPGKKTGPRRGLRQPHALTPSSRASVQPLRQSCCRFAAQDYYDH